MDYVSIIPCLDMKDGRVVKGVHFVELQDAADPVAAAKAYCASGADELAFLDITATVEKRRTMFDVLQKVSAVVTVPLTVGGGIRRLQDIDDALAAGASAVSISSAAYRDPQFVREAVKTLAPSGFALPSMSTAMTPCPPNVRSTLTAGGRRRARTPWPLPWR